MDEKSDDFCTLDISSDLHLSTINFPKFSRNITIPEELNDYLRSQLGQMKNENDALQQQLSKKDLQLQQSQTKVEELSERIKDYKRCCNSEFTSASQLANSKLVELSKKLREKNSEIEVYKSKCSKLENNLSELQKPATNVKRNDTSNVEIVPTKYEKENEALSKENLEIKNNYDELKRKFDVTKTRCKVLETECGVLKSKLASLNQSYEADQHTIAKLTSQVSCHNEQKTEDLKQKEQIIKKLQQENQSLKIELVKEKCVSENKSKELLEKNDDIQLLNKRIRSSRPPSSYIHKHENPEAKTLGRLEVERLRLLELTEVQNTRLEEERNTHLKTQHLLRIEKQKCAKLEASLARLQLEQNSSRSSYFSKINIPKQNETNIKEKLELAEENIKALTTRLEIEIHERKNDLQEFSRILKNLNYK
ncbi:myosin heavy chain, skeletal muscle [Asbolus verrucosus]|uniref:Myosin heavy chain, skeletal muscle n=1 Tax=Asbolus verrucosus TaxID=1661398 RepID=A0A482VIS5_ASBVE|nr:myosin heavy chain, skeletal muscle [Asbolus verrucosus]